MYYKHIAGYFDSNWYFGIYNNEVPKYFVSQNNGNSNLLCIGSILYPDSIKFETDVSLFKPPTKPTLESFQTEFEKKIDADILSGKLLC
ncbi:hypothetical protein ATP_00264 [Candidatus Phytoplasma mali]|uniref:Uncharacterized protein n=1 Tax=Phytoplasma mali (strain AT) TaxID=482235 RepID=B3QZR4_PHYMT|nr:hypothetical protein [Candidatus Phytoplasma mali]CAP18451.1 hypothetical protein ATP_00264 [Candidatus Phytoplasma mali]